MLGSRLCGENAGENRGASCRWTSILRENAGEKGGASSCWEVGEKGALLFGKGGTSSFWKPILRGKTREKGRGGASFCWDVGLAGKTREKGRCFFLEVDFARKSGGKRGHNFNQKNPSKQRSRVRFCIPSTSWATSPASPASYASAPAKDADDASDAGDVDHAGEGTSGNE